MFYFGVCDGDGVVVGVVCLFVCLGFSCEVNFHVQIYLTLYWITRFPKYFCNIGMMNSKTCNGLEQIFTSLGLK